MYIVARLVSLFACFSALQRAENSSIRLQHAHLVPAAPVSVLFSEPKIPQFGARMLSRIVRLFCFSALQRAENSSISMVGASCGCPATFQCSSASRKFLNGMDWLEDFFSKIVFQCSSASRKFLNLVDYVAYASIVQRFSALQRAENSSID